MTDAELSALGMSVKHRAASRMTYLEDEGLAVEVWPHSEYEGQVYTAEFVVYTYFREASGQHLYQRKGATSSPDIVETLDEAEWVMHGGVKWDGCVDYEHNQDDCMLHKCSVRGFEREVRAVRAVYDLAAEFMPHHLWEAA